MKNVTLPCIVCHAELPGVDDEFYKRNPDGQPDHITNQPYGGLAFTSGGHYGGTRFDPMDGSFLEVNICDDCLMSAAKAGRVLIGSTGRHVRYNRVVVGFARERGHLKPWDGTSDTYYDSEPLNGSKALNDEELRAAEEDEDYSLVGTADEIIRSHKELNWGTD